MQKSIRKRLAVFFAGLFFVSLANYLLIKSTADETQELLGWVDHTYEVLLAGENLTGNLRDAETGQRGYLLTQKQEYLAPYHDGVKATRHWLSNLIQLISDNPEQGQKLKGISNLIDRKFAELSETIDLASAGKIHEALKIVNSDIGKNLMDEIRVELQAFMKVERDLLTQREARYLSSQRELETLFIVEAVFFFFSAFLVFYYIQKHIFSPLFTIAQKARRINDKEQYLESSDLEKDEIHSMSNALDSLHEAMAQRTRELEEDRDIAVKLSRVDALTGLYNRRQFEELAELELKRSRREKHYFCLMLMDIDDFKKVNDTYGHKQGDEVLKSVGQCLKQIARRPEDFVFRVGGEEFLLLSSAKEPQGLTRITNEIPKSVSRLALLNENSTANQYVTLSAGVVSVVPDKNDTVDSILLLADKRLYKAKQSGKNKIIDSD